MVIGVLALTAATAAAQDNRGRAPRDAGAESAAVATLERRVERIEQSLERLERAISRLEASRSERGESGRDRGGMMGGGMMGGGMMGGSRPNEQWRSPDGQR